MVTSRVQSYAPRVHFYIIYVMAYESGDSHEQDKWVRVTEGELSSCINGLSDRLKAGSEVEEIEEIAAHNYFLASMYDLVVKRIGSTAGEKEYLYPERYAYIIETVIDDCRNHGKDTHIGTATPEEVTRQGDEKYGSFRAHSIQLAYNLFGDEFGAQAATAFEVFLKDMVDSSTPDIDSQ